MKSDNSQDNTGGRKWLSRSFEELDTDQLYRIIQLRIEVFVVEQCCYYQDLDDKDREAIHLYALDGEKVVAYARLLPKGVSYPEQVSIGRVITSGEHRRTGLGKELMRRAIDECEKRWPGQSIKISAQSYLNDFYTSFGFSQCGEGYLEDGIPHIPMIRISR